MPSLTVRSEQWPLAQAFVISRGAKTTADVVVVEITDGTAIGRGEAVAYARYGESVEGVLAAIAAWPLDLDRKRLLATLPAGAARNAIDCALWDLEAKASGVSAAARAGLGPLRPSPTAYTLSLAPPEAMAAAAQALPHLPVLKLKLGGEGDAERMRAVRATRPDARLIADANEAWTLDMLAPLLAVAAEAGLDLVEQPLPARLDRALAEVASPVTLCADESARTAADIAGLVGRYQAVNIKLDKAGGLTHALEMVAEARRHGLAVMVGSMVATSLAMAPAILLAQDAEWVDLDSPLLLARDREHALGVEGHLLMPPTPSLWG